MLPGEDSILGSREGTSRVILDWIIAGPKLLTSKLRVFLALILFLKIALEPKGQNHHEQHERAGGCKDRDIYLALGKVAAD